MNHAWLRMPFLAAAAVVPFCQSTSAAPPDVVFFLVDDIYIYMRPRWQRKAAAKKHFIQDFRLQANHGELRRIDYTLLHDVPFSRQAGLVGFTHEIELASRRAPFLVIEQATKFRTALEGPWMDDRNQFPNRRSESSVRPAGRFSPAERDRRC